MIGNDSAVEIDSWRDGVPELFPKPIKYVTAAGGGRSPTYNEGYRTQCIA